ncbi:MAG: methionyl-tRNA formyltransferase [Christensenellaceae bacterium]|jgi:methionyl-tRNA formyltransferase|nr:methionyl-tRNA formyltransferase [Christensenellaceae bacterium]
MKIIFLGTPEFAVPILSKIIETGHDVVAVVTQPDRINSRGKNIKLSAVKQFALSHSIPVYQFERISRDGYALLSSLDASIMVTAAFGQILSKEVLNICPFGVINVHASILPKYRGASPVQHAILNGDVLLGVTIMQTALSVDSGDIILIKTLELYGHETSGEVLKRLACLGAEAVIDALSLINSGKAVFTPQNASEATYCKTIKKEDAHINFDAPARTVINFIRAMNPTPIAYTITQYGRLKILEALIDDNDYSNSPGAIVRVDKEKISIMCGDRAIVPLVVQGENGRVMSANEFFRGHRIELNSLFS